MSRNMSLRRLRTVASLSLSVFTITALAAQSTDQPSPDTVAQVYETSNQNLPQMHLHSHDIAVNVATLNAPSSPPFATKLQQNLHHALETMQSLYFSIWLGRYTTAIDWTAAVMSTHVSATLASLSRSLIYTIPGTSDKSKNFNAGAQMVENEINKYFAQTAAYYFGEDHFAIRMQAYDDILWVVLGWLESIQFIEGHSAGHYASDSHRKTTMSHWHARQFIPGFAHRARVFYELAEKGWDWRLCGGGMTWNPRLLPYKNAITNQLFISASINMYLHFPGDTNCSPFLSQYDRIKDKDDRKPNDKLLRAQEHGEHCSENIKGNSSYDPIYLANAIHGYNWLKSSGMTNSQGLYVDGFHIAGYRNNHSKTECDERNEMVYTYNQGVILSGLRGLWEATGNETYLEDGHKLVRNVIRATGWTDGHPTTVASTQPEKPDKIPESQQAVLTDWAGLGSNGILTEACDPSGTCNQNGQTFKGIFFHHLTTFCSPLPPVPVHPGRTYAASRDTYVLHTRSCKEYTKWVVHNANAALQTRDESGRFGSFWGADVQNRGTLKVRREADATDYRNKPNEYMAHFEDAVGRLKNEGPDEERLAGHDMTGDNEDNAHLGISDDLNDRGRGRTVETQGSGIAVLRAMLEFVKLAEGNGGSAPYPWSSRSGAATLSPRYKGRGPNNDRGQFVSESIFVGFIWGIGVLLIWLVILEKLQNALSEVI